MNLVTYFIIAFILSFLGSLPLGMITLTIVQRTIEKGRSSGIMMALGATIMQFFYTYIALISLDVFTTSNEIGHYLKMVATVVFFIMAFYFLMKKKTDELQATTSYDSLDFLRGFIVGLMNVLVVPFWVVLAILLESYGCVFIHQGDMISFSLGSAIGALTVFIGYVWMSEFVMSKAKSINQYTNKVIGILFLGLGIFQLIQFYLN